MVNKKIIFLSVVVLIVAMFFAFSNYFNKIEAYLLFKIFDREMLFGTDEISRELSESVRPGEPYYKDIAIEKMYLEGDDSVYSLRGGEVFRNETKLSAKNDKEKIDRILRLGLFYQRMKEDPLFFGVTLNTDNMSKVLLSLEKKQTEFLSKIGWGYNIFATNFLEKISAASTGYKELENKVSEENAKKLLDKMRNANDAYYDDADNIQKGIEKLLAEKPEFKKNKFASLYSDIYSDFDLILRDFAKIKENSGIVKKEITAREECLSGSVSLCQRSAEKFLKPQKIEIVADSDIRIFSKDFFDILDKDDYDGPYRVKSHCWGGVDEQYLYSYKHCIDPSSCYKRFDLASNIYFLNLQKGTLFPASFDKFMREQKAEVDAVTPTMPYSCFNSEYQPKLSTIDNFYRNFKEKRFYRNFIAENKKISSDLRELISEGENAESAFFDAQYPNEENLEYLADYYGFTYHYLIKKGNASSAEKEDLIKRYVLIKEKFADFDMLLDTNYISFSTFLDRNKIDNIASNMYIYSTRTDYSILFLNFNAFEWKNNAKLEYYKQSADRVDASLPEDLIFDYDKAVSLYGEDNIVKWVKISKENDPKKYEWYKARP
ncbi:MAG: hypothetical protein WC860_10120 [Candidatus Margulisiibacteriota bacterium]|jgi:hypothetical protein